MKYFDAFMEWSLNFLIRPMVSAFLLGWFLICTAVALIQEHDQWARVFIFGVWGFGSTFVLARHVDRKYKKKCNDS